MQEIPLARNVPFASEEDPGISPRALILRRNSREKFPKRNLKRASLAPWRFLCFSMHFDFRHDKSLMTRGERRGITKHVLEFEEGRGRAPRSLSSTHERHAP